MATSDEPQKATCEQCFSYAPGTYLEGKVICESGSADLVLEEDNRRERYLLTGVQDEHAFRFVTQAINGRLQLRSSPGSTADFSVTRVSPPGLHQPEISGDQDCQSKRLSDVRAGRTGEAKFWDQVARDGAPIIEPDPEGDPDKALVTFVYRGAKRNVCLIGAPAPDHVWMKKLAQTSIWFASFRVPVDLRLSYRLAPDVPAISGSPHDKRLAVLAVVQADPFNERGLFRAVSEPHAQWSLLDLATPAGQARQIMELATRNVSEFVLADPNLRGGRRIWLHLPPEFEAGESSNVLQVVFDGAIYLHQLNLPCRIESLIRKGKTPKIATIFVDSVSPRRRSEDLGCNDAFIDHLISEVIPFIIAQIGQRFPAARTLFTGSSLGGLAACYAALTRPEAVGNFISLSGSFWWSPRDWSAEESFIMSLPVPRDLRAVLTAGSYEVARDAADIGILESTLALQKHLGGQAAFVDMLCYKGGHDYAIWEGALTDALSKLFTPERRVV